MPDDVSPSEDTNFNPFEEMVKEVEKERQELREELVNAGMAKEVEAIEEAVVKASEAHKQELTRPTNVNVTLPTDAKQEIEYPKEVIPVAKSVSVLDSEEITKAAQGRLESDIPMNDSYWDVKNNILIKNRQR